jgi:hypothetical protein
MNTLITTKVNVPVRCDGSPSQVRGREAGAGEVGPRGDGWGGELSYAKKQEQARKAEELAKYQIKISGDSSH